MGNSGSKGPKVTDKDKAILQLKIQRDKLKQYEKKINIVIEREVGIAKEQLRLKNHHAARLALAKKKYQLQLLEKTSNQLLQLEQLTTSIEYALIEQDFIRGLEKGNQVLAQIHKEMDLDAVEKLMQDTADGIAYQNEIQNLISGSLTETDEQDILKELEQLVDMQVDSQVIELPKVPQGNLPEIKTQETVNREKVAVLN